MADKLLLEQEFPEPIIHRIQSFLTGKEAARTTILSKSWHRAWLTRPNLDFDWLTRPNLDFDDDHFIDFDENTKNAKRTIKRYEQSNLKIESLNLNMTTKFRGAGLANELIAKALGKLGATRLSLRLEDSVYEDPWFVFPCEVVFGAENLVELSVKGRNIKMVDGMVIKCCRLESLSLVGVDISSDGISNIISSCPLIEKLSLSKKPVGLGGGLWGVQQTERVPENLDRLKCLSLCYNSFKTFFPGDLLSRFLFLKELTLNLNLPEIKCSSLPGEIVDVQISNYSLEHIKIEVGKNCYDSWGYYEDLEGRPRVKLDVPSIRKFTFEGDVIPNLSFFSTSTRKWESHVSVRNYGGLTSSWFGVFNDLLANLRQSKIHLSLDVQNSTESFRYKVGDVESIVRKHELESLTIDETPYFSSYALFDGLFRLCRPKSITQHYRPSVDPDGILCQVLRQGMLVKETIPTRFMYGLNDLEEVNAQIFDDDVPEWRPIPLDSLRDDDRHHRFLLKWKP